MYACLIALIRRLFDILRLRLVIILVNLESRASLLNLRLRLLLLRFLDVFLLLMGRLEVIGGATG